MPEVDIKNADNELLSPEAQWKAAQDSLSNCLSAMHGQPEKPARMEQTGRNTAQKKGLAAKHMLGSPVDLFLNLLLQAMHAKFAVDAKYRKNIKNFTAQYVFKDRSAKICQTVYFAGGKMKVVSGKEPENPTFTLIFRDGKALLALLFSPAPDVLNALLNQEVDFIGNINYLNKFAYMALLAKPHF